MARRTASLKLDSVPCLGGERQAFASGLTGHSIEAPAGSKSARGLKSDPIDSPRAQEAAKGGQTDPIRTTRWVRQHHKKVEGKKVGSNPRPFQLRRQQAGLF